jgi:hypothetical protein
MGDGGTILELKVQTLSGYIETKSGRTVDRLMVDRFRAFEKP